ncbi:TetR/AcrR family transcriptional regulator [Desulfatiferula olefinivorans]
MKNKSDRAATANNREKIIGTAIHLFGERGVEKTSLADIAKAVGISKGTLYYYYSTKNDLIFDITDVHIEKITGEIFSIIETNKGEVNWKEMMGLLFESLLKSETRSRLHLYLIQEVLSGNTELKDRFILTYSQWFKMVAEGYRMITGQDLDIPVQARILVAVIDGLIIQAAIGMQDIPLTQMLGELTKMLDN